MTDVDGLNATDYRLLSLAQAAKLLRVRETVVRELVETGQIRALRVGMRYRIPFGALGELGVSIPPSKGVSILRRVGAARGGNGA